MERPKNQQLKFLQQRKKNISHESPSRIAWRKFRRNPLAMSGLVFILFLAIIVIIGPFIRPDSTVNANDQNLALSRQKPGFSIQTVRVKKTDFKKIGIIEKWIAGGSSKEYDEYPVISIQRENIGYRIKPLREEDRKFFEREFNENELIHHAPLSRTMPNAEDFLFTKTHLLGTDKYGRDLLSRLMAGTVVSLSVGAIAVLISLLVGLTLGLFAGYYRGWTDKIIMWFTNVIWAIPTLILVMAITFAFGTGFWIIFLAVGLTMWVEVARIVRGQVLSVREKEFVEAARALGFSELRIIFKHILPNIISPVIVISAANFASAILIEAGLSFLGLGAQIPTPSWGNMIREHYAYITTDLAYLAIIPGLMIMLLVLSFMLVGNGLRDALDVRD
jgi:ABC-type dipeptide/oligopeptide/nickel transport system permease subunit